MIKDFWKRLSQENATIPVQVKVQPVIREHLENQRNMSEYIRGLVIADYERQQAKRMVSDGISRTCVNDFATAARFERG